MCIPQYINYDSVKINIHQSLVTYDDLSCFELTRTAKLAHIDSKQNKLKALGVDKGKQAQAIMLLGMS